MRALAVAAGLAAVTFTCPGLARAEDTSRSEIVGERSAGTGLALVLVGATLSPKTPVPVLVSLFPANIAWSIGVTERWGPAWGAVSMLPAATTMGLAITALALRTPLALSIAGAGILFGAVPGAILVGTVLTVAVTLEQRRPPRAHGRHPSWYPEEDGGRREMAGALAAGPDRMHGHDHGLAFRFPRP